MVNCGADDLGPLGAKIWVKCKASFWQRGGANARDQYAVVLDRWRGTFLMAGL